MATKGTAAKSASGAAMSKYDVEVEVVRMEVTLPPCFLLQVKE